MRGSAEVPGIGVNGNRMGTSCAMNMNAVRIPELIFTVSRVSV